MDTRPKNSIRMGHFCKSARFTTLLISVRSKIKNVALFFSNGNNSIRGVD